MNKIIMMAVALAFIPTLVFATSATDAKSAMDGAKADIATLAGQNISTFAVNDLLKEAELQYSQGNYNRSAELAAQISALKNSAVNYVALMNEIDVSTAELEKAGADTKGIRDAVAQANEAYQREDFKSAEEYALNARSLVEDAQSKAGPANVAAQGEALRLFAVAHWPELLVAAAAIIAAAYYVSKDYLKKSGKRKVAGLKARKENLLKLMKEAQKRHFVDGDIGRNEYAAMMQNYRRQMADANRQLELLKRAKR